mmetsp:Transcript_4986/g.5608  ORF Transcript_4986/g.5608 Transcript_4986/m.5608 type:complete len:280 (-) Transcript_4986:285-1124(-)
MKQEILIEDYYSHSSKLPQKDSPFHRREFCIRRVKSLLPQEFMKDGPKTNSRNPNLRTGDGKGKVRTLEPSDKPRLTSPRLRLKTARSVSALEKVLVAEESVVWPSECLDLTFEKDFSLESGKCDVEQKGTTPHQTLKRPEGRTLKPIPPSANYVEPTSPRGGAAYRDCPIFRNRNLRDCKNIFKYAQVFQSDSAEDQESPKHVTFLRSSHAGFASSVQDFHSPQSKRANHTRSPKKWATLPAKRNLKISRSNTIIGSSGNGLVRYEPDLKHMTPVSKH